MEFTGHLQGAIDGARVLLQSALALAVAVATSLALARMRLGRLVRGALLYSLAAVAMGALARPVPADVVASSVLLVFGVLIAAGVRLQGWTPWAAIIAGGIASGLAGKMQTASGAESAGGAVVLFLLMLFVGMLTRIPAPARLHRAAGLARRMAGAWLAAVGVLMIALWMRGAA
jgi:hypothetical protein